MHQTQLRVEKLEASNLAFKQKNKDLKKTLKTFKQDFNAAADSPVKEKDLKSDKSEF